MKYLNERNEDWKEYWSGEDSRVYFVHGKDNIPFHTVVFPAILCGIGINDSNLRMISSEHLKLEGKSFSAGKNWALRTNYIIKNYNVDSFRYYLMLNSPENNDTDFSWREYINLNNNYLVDVISNYVEGIINFSRKNYGPRIPYGIIDNDLKNEILDLYFSVGDDIELGCFNSALNNIMTFCKKASRNFNENLLGSMIEKNAKECRNIVYTNIQIVANLSNLLEPFMPNVCKKIREGLSINKPIWSFIEKRDCILKQVDLEIKKIDKKRVTEELLRLKEIKKTRA